MAAGTTIIYLIGKPGTGKYTISQELAKSGYVICDNQLVAL
jgi:dephospho-CoA kinase